MRGEDEQQGGMWSYVSAEDRIAQDHPIRVIRTLVDSALVALSPRFEGLYSKIGRPSIAPERLLRALVLQLLYTIRSERQLMEQLNYNLLFRWFVGLAVDDPVWDVTVFTKNRERLLQGEVAGAFFSAVVEQARERGLLSQEHFTVDGTLLQAWAGHKSFRPKDPPPTSSGEDWHGQARSNDTHQSTTDPDARLYKKATGAESKLCYLGHVLTENRNGLVVQAALTQAGGTQECEAAIAMLEQVGRTRITLGADKAYDRRDFITALRQRKVTPHIAQRQRSVLDGRTTRHPGYQVSQRKRKRVEQVFGWMKSIGGLRQAKLRGLPRVSWAFAFAAAAYNVMRIARLLPVPT